MTLPIFSSPRRLVVSMGALSSSFLPEQLSLECHCQMPYSSLYRPGKKGLETWEQGIFWIIQGGSVDWESALFLCTLTWTDILAVSSQGSTKERVWRKRGRRGRSNKFEYNYGQGGLACCDSCGHKESDTTEWLKWTEPNQNLKNENSNGIRTQSLVAGLKAFSPQIACWWTNLKRPKVNHWNNILDSGWKQKITKTANFLHSIKSVY